MITSNDIPGMFGVQKTAGGFARAFLFVKDAGKTLKGESEYKTGAESSARSGLS